MNPTLRTFLEPHSTMHKGMVVHWHREETSDTLHYRVEGTSTWSTQASTTKEYPHRDETIHKVVLDDLEPDTAYEFRFDGEGESDIQKFKVPPRFEPESYKVAILSDHQRWASVNDSVFRKITSNIADDEPNLVVFNGDILACKGAETSTMMNSWATFLGILSDDFVTPSGYKLPVIFTIGNHDSLPDSLDQGGESRPPNNLFRFTHCIWDDVDPNYNGGYGFLTCGDWLLVLVLDTHHHNAIQPQTAWLKGLYERFGNRFKYVFPIQHIHPFPSFRNFDMEGQEHYTTAAFELRDKIHKIYQDFGVRYVSVAHEHVWSISPPLYIPDSISVATEEDTEIAVAPDHPRAIRYVGGGACHSSVVRDKPEGERWWIEDSLGVANFWTLVLGDTKVSATGKDDDDDVLLANEQMMVVAHPFNSNPLNFGGG
jgi:hypothetical protein